jgi:hypothetical protein
MRVWLKSLTPVLIFGLMLLHSTTGDVTAAVFWSIHATSIPYDICRGILRSVDPSAFSISRYTGQ